MAARTSFLLVFASLCCGGRSLEGAYVAFLADVTNSQSLPGDGIAIFNRVVTNIGNGYNNTTGVFTCPIPGLYVFHLNVLDESDRHLLFLRICKNSEVLADVWAKSQSSQYEMAGNTAVVSLQKGDRVFIKEGQGFPNILYGEPTKRYSTFSGFLVGLLPEDEIIG